MADAGKLPGFVPWLALAAVVALVLFLAGPLLMRYAQDRDILASGDPAPARVVEVIDTGRRVNANPQVRLKLEVQPAGDEPFPAEVVVVLSAVSLQKVRPGSVVAVKYDPEDPSRVALAPE